MDKIFVNGLISKEVEETAPAFILGKLSISVDNLIKWLETEGKKNANNGWLNLTIKKSQLGKRYIEVDTYKPAKKEEIKVVQLDELPVVDTEIPF